LDIRVTEELRESESLALGGMELKRDLGIRTPKLHQGGG